MNTYYFCHNTRNGLRKLYTQTEFDLWQDDLRVIAQYEADSFADALNALNEFSRNHENRMRGAA